MPWTILNPNAGINITGLPEENSVSAAVDEVVFYDASAGANRKTAVTNIVPSGSVTLDKLPDGVLTADTAGRAKMADGFVTLPKIPDGVLTADSAGRAKMADAFVTPEKLTGAQTGTAPIYGARAWVCFDATRNEADSGASTNGANVKIYAGGNVTSVLKNATGDYTVNFTTALPDANYAISMSTQTNASVNGFAGFGGLPTLKSTTEARVVTASGGGNVDYRDVSFVAFR
jgi:hypothetical protein